MTDLMGKDGEIPDGRCTQALKVANEVGREAKPILTVAKGADIRDAAAQPVTKQCMMKVNIVIVPATSGKVSPHNL